MVPGHGRSQHEKNAIIETQNISMINCLKYIIISLIERVCVYSVELNNTFYLTFNEDKETNINLNIDLYT